MRKITVLLWFLSLFSCQSKSQGFLLGADMSYVNEMLDCGVVFKKENQERPPFELLKEEGGQLVRLRLWHTPAWYDTLNTGNRYSDLEDVKRSIAQIKAEGMQTLLDFHLSDNWADPKKQLVPAAWLPIVDDLPVLKDSLNQYIFSTLESLHKEGLLPEMIQIGNETNKGILLSPSDNEGFTLEWNRNAQLFNAALDAVEAFESQYAEDIEIMLHVAGPDNAEWMINGFIQNGVNRFDWIGISYYWAWHQPTSIEETGHVVQNLRTLYPDKKVMIAETGYIWTNDYNDNAANIISETHPDYSPASPSNQRQWLVDMTQAVIDQGAEGVLYWEPFWVSSPCFTQWGQGSHQEHATFFNFDNNLIENGGVRWLSHAYNNSTSTLSTTSSPIQIWTNSFSGDISIRNEEGWSDLTIQISNQLGQIVLDDRVNGTFGQFKLKDQPFGLYNVSISRKGKTMLTKRYLYSNQ